MNCTRINYESGTVCLFTSTEGSSSLADELKQAKQSGEFGFCFVFFSKKNSNARQIIALMEECAPGLHYTACSTAGEITPDGITEGSLMIIMLPDKFFRVEARSVRMDKKQSLQESSNAVVLFRSDFMAKTARPGHSSSFAICLTDGMSFSEEMVAATLHLGLEDLPLLGGSAGDDLNFNETELICDGVIVDDGAILVLLECFLPVHIFKTENFVPTSQKLVVTRSDPARRIVYEFNAANAAEVYAEAVGVEPSSLSPMTFASHPVVMRVGDEFYCRSIQKVNDDKSLSFFCAIDDGIVLTVAEPTGMARSTASMMEAVEEHIGCVDFVLGFDCVLRRIDAHNRQVTRKIGDIYQRNRLIGFNTYGEQYRSMHLNQTLTGVAFGAPSKQQERPT